MDSRRLKTVGKPQKKWQFGTQFTYKYNIIYQFVSFNLSTTKDWKSLLHWLLNVVLVNATHCGRFETIKWSLGVPFSKFYLTTQYWPWRGRGRSRKRTTKNAAKQIPNTTNLLYITCYMKSKRQGYLVDIRADPSKRKSGLFRQQICTECRIHLASDGTMNQISLLCPASAAIYSLALPLLTLLCICSEAELIQGVRFYDRSGEATRTH